MTRFYGERIRDDTGLEGNQQVNNAGHTVREQEEGGRA